MARKILLVEGKDDEHVMKSLFRNRQLPAIDEIKEHGGVGPLLESFPVRLKASQEGDVVGLVVDADVDLESRWQSLRGRLAEVGFQPVPFAPDPGGTILDPP